MKNMKRTIATALTVILIISLLSACQPKPFVRDVTVSKTAIADSAKVEKETIQREGFFTVYFEGAIMHPRFEKDLIDEKSGQFLAVTYVVNSTSAVVTRDGQVVYAIAFSSPMPTTTTPKDVYFNLDSMKYKGQRLRNVEIAFLIPEEYKNDTIEIVFATRGYYQLADDGSYIEPEGIWFRHEVA